MSLTDAILRYSLLEYHIMEVIRAEDVTRVKKKGCTGC